MSKAAAATLALPLVLFCPKTCQVRKYNAWGVVNLALAVIAFTQMLRLITFFYITRHLSSLCIEKPEKTTFVCYINEQLGIGQDAM